MSLRADPPAVIRPTIDLSCAWTREVEAGERLDGVLRVLDSQALTPSWATLFATRRLAAALIPGLSAAGAWTRWPLMVLITPGDEPQGGFEVMGVRGVQRLVRDEGRVVGVVWKEADGGEKASLCGLMPARELAPDAATADLLARAGRLLSGEGMGWPDVYRTWYYNDRILDWYDGFNNERTKAYRAAEVRLERAPASTGIGLANQAGLPLTLALFAGMPPVCAEPVMSPLQNSAMNYGSLFSRATEESIEDHKRLWVSGTASIDPEGRTCHLGDFTAQARRTFETVEAILTSRGLAWSNVCRATAYVREPANLADFRALVKSGALPDLPVVVIAATVCRDDLLFELELDAVQ